MEEDNGTEVPLIIEEGIDADCEVESVDKKKGFARFKRSLKLCCMTSSVFLNVILAGVIYMVMRNNDSYHPIKPPAPANDTKYYCPFTSADAADYKSDIAITEVNADYISVCWRDIIEDERGTIQTPYTLKVDDYWTDKTVKLADPVYRGRSLHFNTTDLLPAVKYTFELATKDGQKATVSATTSERGYCGNPADVAAQKAAQGTMKADIQGCMIKNVFSDSGARDCIVDKVGISPKCADCWVQEGHCTLKKCAGKCLNPASEACKKCSEDACFPDCILCSGLPAWTFPP